MREFNRKGWSLLEIAIVVTIIAILAALAIPGFQLILKKSRFTALANDLRQFGDAFQTHALQQGDFPPSHGTPGSIVPGMEGLLSRKWLENSPIGGVYTWGYTQQPLPAAEECYIQLVETGSSPFSVTLADVVELDKTLDDGNLATGRIQIAGNRIRFYVKMAED